MPLAQPRIATPHDAAGIAAIYAPIVEQTAISFEVDPPDSSEIARRIETSASRWPWLVVDDGNIRGYAYAGEHRSRAAYRWSVDVSVYVAADARRAGIGRRLYVALFAILREQGFCTAFAGVALPNEPSLRLHRDVGFEPIGIYRNVGYKLGAWHDVAWLQRQLSTPGSTPAEPRPFAAIRDDVERRLCT